MGAGVVVKEGEGEEGGGGDAEDVGGKEGGEVGLGKGVR